ncbi:MAG: cytochrome c-type biogenesis CcmF C-terminal domain-containing protein [Anaerolineae bacterium]
MITEVGAILLGLALASAIYAAYAIFRGIRHNDPRWAESGCNAVYATTVLLGLSLLALLVAFLSNQFQTSYVAQHSSRELPPYLKVSALWAGQEGSLLLWSFLQALFAALVIRRPPERQLPLVPWATVFLSIITAFFVAVTFLLSSPFQQLNAVPANGQGLNPLLRHPGMIFHPPALYLGYVALAVPFAFAMAALLTHRIEVWPAAARRWSLAAWLFLGLGILLGARWAYDVLGWGGYWGWDPVENAALMPWLTATALLHGTVMQEQRGSFRLWNLALAVLSFLLVLFGTFTTRSGLIQSVHSFGRSVLGPYFLAFMGLTLAVSLALLYRQRTALTAPSGSQGFISREGMFLITVILFMTITASVFVGSILPTLTEAFSGNRFEAGPQWFDRVTGPQFGALVLVMGVCPLLGAAAASLRRLRLRALPALVLAVLLTGGMALVGFTRLSALIGFAVIGLAGGTTLAEYGFAVVARSRSEARENALSALWHLFGRNRRRYGGFLVHAGVILMALGIIGTRIYPFETEVVLASGKPVTVQDYALVYEEARQEPAADHLVLSTDVSVYRHGGYLTTLRPRLSDYLNSEQTIASPALGIGLREDLYLVLAGINEDGSSATFKVVINPLVNFLWLGGLVFLAGGTIALWPSAPAAARRRKAWAAVGLAVSLLVLVAAGIAMWGTGHGAIKRATGRPLVGQAPPGFILSLLDGGQLTLADLQGKPTVINFWATWCKPCKEELPALQSVWNEYQNKGVRFVGIAYKEQEATVRAAIGLYSLTYPLGLDAQEAIANSYGITAVPETFILDSQGKVAYVHIGQVTAEQLRQELDSLLGS